MVLLAAMFAFGSAPAAASDAPYYEFAGYSTSTDVTYLYTSSSTTFTVPQAPCASNEKSGVTIWGGLQGISPAGQPAVEQTGISLECKNGKLVAAPWWEMTPDGPVFLNTDTLKINIGDKVESTVSYSGGEYELGLADLTTGQKPFTTVQSGPGSNNSTAVCTVEFVPSSSQTPQIPYFAPIHFSSCTANGLPIGEWGGSGDSPATHHPPAVFDTSPLSGGTSFTVSVASPWTEYLNSQNDSSPPEYQYFYGQPGDKVLMCDWDGNGSKTPGVVRGITWYIWNSNGPDLGLADYEFSYGDLGDQFVCGDWNGDGIQTPGVFRNGVWYLRNENSTGAGDVTVNYGNVGDTAVVGNWDGTAGDGLGVVRGTTWYLTDNLDGTRDIASFGYGNIGDSFITGDWDGNGTDGVGVYRNATFYLVNSLGKGTADLTFPFGTTGDMPVAGNWSGTGSADTIGVVRPPAS